MRPTFVARLLCGLLMLSFCGVALSACGSDKEDKAEQKRKEAAAQQLVVERRERQEEARRAKEAQAKADACGEQLEPLLDVLSELDSRLDVGLSYDEYTDKVGDVVVEYDKLDFESVDDVTCLTTVGVPAEAALEQYRKAAEKWSACFEDIDCETDSIKSSLRGYWSRASAKTDKAKEALSEMADAS